MEESRQRPAGLSRRDRRALERVKHYIAQNQPTICATVGSCDIAQAVGRVNHPGRISEALAAWFVDTHNLTMDRAVELAGHWVDKLEQSDG